MSNSSFDLSSVIGLLGALATNTNPLVINPATVAAKRSHTTLGDFTTIWEFLGVPAEPETTTADDDSSPPAPPQATPKRRPRRRKGANIPEIAEVVVDGSPVVELGEVPRPNVLFSPARGLSGGGPAGPAVELDAHQINGGLWREGEEGEEEGEAEVVRRPVIRSLVTPAERKSKLVQKIIAAFPAQASALLARPNIQPEATDADIHVFIDASNIVISFYELIKKRRGYPKNVWALQPAFSFHSLSLILERGRTCSKRAFVGSSPITPVVLEARALGYETSILERVEKERPYSRYSSSSGSETTQRKRLRKVEQGVDEIIHLKILESVLDFVPATIVLASGDAAVGEYSPGFFRVVERCLERGWKVELVSFKSSLSWLYYNKEFLAKWKSSFMLVLLDSFVEELLG